MHFNHQRFFLAPAALLCWCFFFLAGCKDPIVENTDLLTTDDDLSVDTAILYAYANTFAESPAQSNGSAYGVLGSMNDPVFGKTYGSFYCQVKSPSNSIVFPPTAVLDSAVLRIKLYSKYGRANQPLNVMAYELNQTLDATTAYYTNYSYPVISPAIGLVSGYVPNFSDSIASGIINYAPSLRVRVDAAGEKILHAAPEYLIDNAAFQNFFKGFYLTTNQTFIGNGFIYLDLNSGNTVTPSSALTIYYHDSTGAASSFDFPITTDCARFNHFDRERGAEVQSAIDNPNAAGDEKVYVQAAAGSKAKFQIMNLDSLPANIAINKAELIMTMVNDPTGWDSVYDAPTVLSLLRVEGDSLRTLEDDFRTTFGVRKGETVDGISVNRYHFNITYYFQNLYNHTYTNEGLMLQAYAPATSGERVVISGTQLHSTYRPTILITYTKL